MGEGIRHNLSFLLHTVVADSGGRSQGLIDIARIEEIVLLLRTACPDAGVAVGMKLNTHLKPVRLSFARGRLLRPHDARQNAEFVLHVVIDFMRDHRGFGEFASVAMRAAAELGRQALKDVSR